MQAALFNPDEGITLHEIPRPTVMPGDVLVEVHACGICGTDLRIMHSGHRRIPEGQSRILGHELSGVLVEGIAAKEQLSTGTRVVIAPNIGCGVCDLCIKGSSQLCPDYISFGVALDGGFAEYMLVPAAGVQQGNVSRIPDHLSFEETALLEPLSCCYHGLTACQVIPGDEVLVIGAGPIGIMHMQLARVMGAARIACAAKHPDRLDLFPSQVADVVFDVREADLPEAIRDSTDGKGFDVIIVAAPSREAQSLAIDSASIHGRINFFGGLPKHDPVSSLDANKIHYRELIVTGTTGQTLADFRKSLTLLAKGMVNLQDLITDRYPLKDIHAAIKTAEQKSGMKTIVLPHTGEPS